MWSIAAGVYNPRDPLNKNSTNTIIYGKNMAQSHNSMQ